MTHLPPARLISLEDLTGDAEAGGMSAIHTAVPQEGEAEASDARGVPAIHTGVEVVEGSGGGKKPSPPYEAPNTLRAKQILRVIYLVSAGPTGGLIDGGKSIFFGDTPVVASDGSTNIPGVTWEIRYGTGGEEHISGVPAQEQFSSVGVEVTVASGPRVQTFDMTNYDRVRILMTIPALVEMRDNGDQLPSRVTYKAQWRIAGTSGAFQDLFSDTIEGKCVAPYPRAKTVAVPHRGQVEIRIVRETPDSTTTKLMNKTVWAGVNLILDRKLDYADCALVALTIDQSQFQQGLPAITFGWRGIWCWVPTNYDPVTRVYANTGPGTSGGIWNGTFKRAFTRNPAWILLTLLVDPLWGCGNEVSIDQLDRYAFYEIGQYSDEAVPTGLGDGSTEPRYTFNWVLNQRDDAIRAIQAISSAFRGMTYWGPGVIVPVADMPKPVTRLVTPENTVDGKIRYEESSSRARHSLVKVRWRDPALGYLENIEVVQDAELMSLVGIRELELEAVGCTSRGLAARTGRWALYTEKHEDKLATYRAGTDHADCVPGEIIAIQDPQLVGRRYSGRLRTAWTAAAGVVLDEPVLFEAGVTYSLRMQLPNGRLTDPVGLSFAQSTTTDTLAIPALADGGVTVTSGNGPEAGYVWYVVPSSISPTEFRVLDVEPQDDGTYAVTAHRHFAAKFGHIENGLALQDLPFTLYRNENRPLSPPSAVTVQESVTGLGPTAILTATVGWTPSSDTRTVSHEIEVLRSGTTAVVASQVTAAPSWTFTGLAAGDHVFRVRAIGPGNLVSAWATSEVINVDGKVDPPAHPSNLAATPGIKQVAVTFTPPANRFLSAVEVKAGVNTIFTAASKVGESTTGGFIHTGLQANTTYYYWVRSRDIFGQYSAPEASGWLGPVSAKTSLLLTEDIADAILTNAKFAQSIQPVGIVDAVPGAKGSNPDLIYNTTNGRMYRWNGAAYVQTVADLDPNVTVPSGQIESLDAAKLTGNVDLARFPEAIKPVERLATLPANNHASNFNGRMVLNLADGKLYRYIGTPPSGAFTATIAAGDVAGALAAANFPQDLRPVEVVGALPSSGNFQGRQVLLTSDNKLYRWTSSSVTTGTAHWVTGVAAADLSGQLASAVFPSSLRPVEVVGTLPNTGLTAGRVVFLTTDGKLYRYNGTAWTAAVAAADISGELAATNFPSNLRPLEVVATLPSSGNFLGRQVFLTSDSKIYRWTSSSVTTGTAHWTAGVPAVDITTPLTPTNFDSSTRPLEVVSVFPTTNRTVGRLVFLTAADPAQPTLAANRLYRWNGTAWVAVVAAADLDGQLTNSQIADLSAAKLTSGTIDIARFAEGARPIERVSALPAGLTSANAGRVVFLTTDSKLYRWTGSAWTSAVPASDVSGALAASNFPDDLRPIERVSALPTTNLTEGRVVLLTTDGKLYRRVGSNWVSSVAAADITGTLANAQIEAVAASKISGSLTSDQIEALNAAKLTGSLELGRFPNALRPVEVVGALPATGNFEGRVVMLTTDDKLYRHDGTAWIRSVDGGDLVAGTVTANAIQAGAISADKIAANTITASKLVVTDSTNLFPDPNMMDDAYYSGSPFTLVATGFTTTGARRIQIAAGAVREVVTGWFEVSPDTDYLTEILAYRESGTCVGQALLEWGTLSNLGAITAISPRVLLKDTSVSNAQTRLALAVTSPATARRARFVFTTDAASGQFTAGKPEMRRRANASLIVDGAITAAKVSAGAIETDKLAATAVTADKIAANAVTAAKIEAGAVETAKLAAGAVSADKIQAGAISADKIAANAILATKLTVGDTTNIFPDPNMLDDAYYSGAAGYGFIYTGLSAAGARRLQIASGAAEQVVVTGWFEVAPSTDYLAEIMAYRESGTAAATNLTVSVEWGSLGNTASPSVTPLSSSAVVSAYSGTSQARQSATMTSPATARRARFVFTRAAGADGTVTAAKPELRRRANGSLIVDGAVTADKIAANAVNADKILAGSITSAQIAASTISADRMILGDFSNRVENPNFTLGAVGWVLGTNTSIVTDDAANAFLGTSYLKVDTGAPSAVRQNLNTFTVVPGDRYFLRATCKATSNASGALRIRIRWMNAAGSPISTSELTWTAADTAYVARSLSATAPANAVRAWVDYFNTANMTAGTYYVGEVFCHRQNTAELIVDGAVTAAKVSAGAIETDKLAASAVTAAKLSVGSGNNFVWNACCPVSTEGWSADGGGVLSVADSTWALQGFGSGRVTLASIAAGATPSLYWTPATGLLAAAPGQVWEAQIKGIPLGCDANVRVGFYGPSGYISEVSSSYAAMSNSTATKGWETSDYMLAWVRGTAPAGTNRVQLFIRIRGVGGAAATNASFTFTQALLGLTANAGVTEAQPWVPGGTTAISGGVIRTDAIAARHISANAVTADKILAGAVTTGKLDALAVTAEKIAAGAIVTDKLDAQAVTAAKLAASAVEADKIAANAVTAGKIATDAVTAGAIQAGAIATDKLQAGSVTASKLVLADTTNMFPDPNLKDPGFYSEVSATTNGILLGSSGSLSLVAGEQRLLINANAAEVKIASGWIEVAPGTDYHAEAGLWRGTGTTGNGRVQLEWATLNGATVTPLATVAELASTGAGSQSSRFGLAVTSPTSARRARFIFVRDAGGDGAYGFGRPELRRRANSALIVDGAVTADKIAANAVTAGKVAANAIEAGALAAGAVTAAKIQAGSIVASKLAIADYTNLYPDPNMLDAAFYSGPVALLTPTGLATAGTNRLLISANAAAQVVNSNWFEVSSSTNYFLEAYAQRDGGTSGSAQVEIEWGSLSNTAQETVTALSKVTVVPATSATAPARANATALSPSNARRARFVFTRLAGGDGTVSFAKPEIRERATAELIVDGAITVDKLAANSVTAGAIQAGAISADKIQANSITASRLVLSDFTNLVENPIFADGALSWLNRNASDSTTLPTNISIVTGDAANAFQGNCYLRGVAPIASQGWLRNVNIWPVFAGNGAGAAAERYYLRATARCVAGTSTGTFQVRLRFLAADKSTIVGSAAAVSFFATDNAGYVTRGVEAVVPAGAVYVWADIIFPPITAGEWRLGEVFCHRKNGSELIVDGAIKAAQLDANSVTAAKLAVGSANNVVWNSCLAFNDRGWTYSSNTGSATRGVAPAAYKLANYGSGYWAYPGALTNGLFVDAIWRPFVNVAGAAHSGRLPCQPGQVWEGQARVMNKVTGSTGQVLVCFYDAAGAFLQQSISANAAPSTAVTANALSDYTLLVARGTAPANAASVDVRVRLNNSSGASISNPEIYWTQVGLGLTVAGAVDAMPWTPGGATEIDGAMLRTGTVAAQHIAAGSITTEKLAVGGGNLIWNSCCPYNTKGWVAASDTPNTTAILGAWPVTGPGSEWRLRGVGTGALSTVGTLAPGGGVYVQWQPDPPNLGLPVFQGRRYQASVLVQNHACSSKLEIHWINGANQTIGVSESAIQVANQLTDAAFEERYARLTIVATAPANAVYGFVRLLMLGTGGTNPYVMFTKALFGETAANATEVTPWVAGGMTHLEGGMLRANSIGADQIIAGSIGTDQLAANSITAGKIQAGAIGATQIAAQQIAASHLVTSQEVITQSAQIGTAVIKAAQIGDLEVDTIKIKSGAISDTQVVTWNAGYSSTSWSPTIMTMGIGDAIYPSTVMIQLTGVHNGGMSLELAQNGTPIFYRMNMPGWSLIDVLKLSLGPGTHTFAVRVSVSQLRPDTGPVAAVTIAATMLKR